jgi:hypothetical protein
MFENLNQESLILFKTRISLFIIVALLSLMYFAKKLSFLWPGKESKEGLGQFFPLNSNFRSISFI